MSLREENTRMEKYSVSIIEFSLNQSNNSSLVSIQATSNNLNLFPGPRSSGFLGWFLQQIACDLEQIFF